MPWRNLKVAELVPETVESIGFKTRWELAIQVSGGRITVTEINALNRIKFAGRKAIVSSAFPHFGEESVLQGWNGSGTIFFGMCNLRCVFCQNWDISQKKNGWELGPEEIADLMLKLQNEKK